MAAVEARGARFSESCTRCGCFLFCVRRTVVALRPDEWLPPAGSTEAVHTSSGPSASVIPHASRTTTVHAAVVQLCALITCRGSASNWRHREHGRARGRRHEYCDQVNLIVQRAHDVAHGLVHHYAAVWRVIARQRHLSSQANRAPRLTSL